MDQYPHYREAIGCFAEIIRKLGNPTPASRCYYTGSLLIRLNLAIGDMCEAILLQGIRFYPCAILYRALTEHVIKHVYTWLRYLVDCDDNVAKRYVFDGSVHEMYRAAQSLFPQSSWPELKSYLEENLDINNLKEISDEFEIKGILKYLDQLQGTSGRFEEALMQIRKEIPKLRAAYSKLSSYVHGGPRALMKTMDEQAVVTDIRQCAIAWTVLSQLLTARFFGWFHTEREHGSNPAVERLQALFDELIAPTGEESDVRDCPED